MFESLSDRLQNAIHKIKGYGTITEENISDVIGVIAGNYRMFIKKQ